MAKKTAVVKLDRDGFVFILSIGAIVLILFTIYFLNFRSTKLESLIPIKSAAELDIILENLNKENPDSFKVDLNANSQDAVNF